MRTTGLQVSGYAFLLRRTELALVIGDARMAQDPLRTQRRAIGVGLLLALLVTGAMLLVAMLRPQPSIDDAGLVADESGSLHVRLGEAFHPVTNVASARLLLGSPDEVTSSTAEQLGRFPTGPQVGVPDAPGLVAAPVSQWARCADGVVAAPSLPDAGATVLAAPSGMWLAVDGRRLRLADGPVLARALGATPVAVPDEVLRVLDRGPDVALTGLREIIHAGDRAFLAGGSGVAEVTGARRAVAEALARGTVAGELSAVLARPEVGGVAALEHIPADLEVTGGGITQVCVGETVVDAEAPPVPTPAQDTRFGGPRGTSAVFTERGVVLVSDTGVRYQLTGAEDLAVLGLTGDDTAHLPEVPHRVLEALPDGGVLSEERASHTLSGG